MNYKKLLKVSWLLCLLAPLSACNKKNEPTEEEFVEALDGYECFIKYGKNKRASKPHPVAVNL